MLHELRIKLLAKVCLAQLRENYFRMLCSIPVAYEALQVSIVEKTISTSWAYHPCSEISTSVYLDCCVPTIWQMYLCALYNCHSAPNSNSDS